MTHNGMHDEPCLLCMRNKIEFALMDRGYDEHPADMALWDEAIDEVMEIIASELGVEA